MKQLLLAMSLTVFSATAFSATCFNFVNGKGPSRIANSQFAAAASKVCISNRNGETTVTFSDAEGDLAIVAALETSTGRCGGFCKNYNLSYGNINGSNVDVSGATLSINSEVDYSLGVSKGTLSLQTSRSLPEKYLIIQSK